MNKFCTSCGASVAVDANTCPACNAQLGAPAPQPQVAQPQQPVFATQQPQQPIPQPQAAPPQPMQQQPQQPIPQPQAAPPQPMQQQPTYAPPQPQVDVQPNAATVNPMPQAGVAQNKPAKEKKPLDVKIVAIIAAVALVVIIVTSVANMGGYKKPIDSYFKGMESGKAKTIQAAFPKQKKSDFDSDMLDDMREAMQETYGEKFKITYKIKSKVELGNKNLTTLQKQLEEDDIEKVKKAYRVEVEVKIKGDKKTKKETQKIVVYQYKNKWYMS